jgi:drug/metabolite transporter (DMT)-like permease
LSKKTVTSWTIPALIASLFFAAHYLTLRGASGRVGDAFGGFLLEASATVGLLVLMLLLPKEIPATTSGIVWSIVSGLCITGGVTFLFMALRLGGPVAGTGTIALGGGVVLASLLAPLLFSETITVRRAVGVGLGLAATVILATEKS